MRSDVAKYRLTYFQNRAAPRVARPGDPPTRSRPGDGPHIKTVMTDKPPLSLADIGETPANPLFASFMGDGVDDR